MRIVKPGPPKAGTQLPPDPHPIHDARTLALGVAHVVNQEGYIKDGLFDHAKADVRGTSVLVEVDGRHYVCAIQEVSRP